MKKSIFLCAFLFVTVLASAQVPNFQRYDTVVVKNILGIPLENPWAGGLNYIMMSGSDFNFDGKQDLFIFDYQFQRISTYINIGSQGVSRYRHRAKYQDAFPFAYNYGLLRDFNCDGKKDYFCYNAGGLSYYENISTPLNHQYKLVEKKINANHPINGNVQIFAGPPDYPCVDDVDYDGDLDILTWSNTGQTIWYYKNMSMENYGVCDSLDFVVANTCWGFINENPTASVPQLHYYTCPSQVPNPESSVPDNPFEYQTKGAKHYGGTILLIDHDQDTVMDLVTSDTQSKNLMLLHNGGRPDSTEFDVIDTLFPKNTVSTVPVNLSTFPTAHYLDIDNDSVKDLIAAPHAYNNPTARAYADNKHGVVYYRNTGTDDNPNFQYTSNEFLQNTMIDVGEGCYPRFFDYNNDGLEDLVIGNFGYYTNHYQLDAKLSLYKNIGTATKPEYQYVTDDYSNVSSVPLDADSGTIAHNLVPTFGDLDGDGDEDMIIGDEKGYFHFFKNTAPPNNDAVFTIDSIRFQGIDVGFFAAPFLVDLDRDSLMDLVIGERGGHFHYYRNTGTASYPSFTLVTNTLGNVQTSSPIYINIGFSCPYFHDNNGNYEMYSGSIDGGIHYYTNIDGNLTGTFTLHEDTLGGFWEGGRTCPSGADINNDGMLDLVIGNYCGGLALYKQNFPVGLEESPVVEDMAVMVYPNPNNGEMTIDLGPEIPVANLEVYNLFGQMLLQQKVKARDRVRLDHLQSGTYIFRFSSANGAKQHIERVVLTK